MKRKSCTLQLVTHGRSSLSLLSRARQDEAGGQAGLLNTLSWPADCISLLSIYIEFPGGGSDSRILFKWPLASGRAL